RQGALPDPRHLRRDRPLDRDRVPLGLGLVHAGGDALPPLDLPLPAGHRGDRGAAARREDPRPLGVVARRDLLLHAHGARARRAPPVPLATPSARHLEPRAQDAPEDVEQRGLNVRLTLENAALAALVCLALGCEPTNQGYEPTQPIEFS